jgi:hypothetical protein
MAIQFDCPYCTATLRVPDQAAATIGRCPKCESKLRVPVVPIPGKATAPARAAKSDTPSSPPEQAPAWEDETIVYKTDSPLGAAIAEANRAVQAGTASPSAARIDPVADFLAQVADPIVAAPMRTGEPVPPAPERNRLRQNRTGLWVTIAFVLAAAGIGFGYWWQSRSTFIVAIEGDAMPASSVAGVIAQRDYKLPDADWANIRRALEQAPADLRNRQMVVKIESAPRGLKVSLTPGRDGELVSVSLASIPGLAELVASNRATLDAPRQEALLAGLQELAQKIQEATAAGKPPDLATFGQSIGINGLIGPLGYHTQAVIDRVAYPCVFEDREGRLYFLVPPGTESFTVRPKAPATGEREPFHLSATVKVNRKAIEPVDDGKEASPTSEPKESDEAEPQAAESPSPAA